MGDNVQKNMPFSDEDFVVFEATSNFDQFFKMISNRWVRLRGSRMGFTVFHSDAKAWFSVLREHVSFVEGVPF